VIFGYHRAIV